MSLMCVTTSAQRVDSHCIFVRVYIYVCFVCVDICMFVFVLCTCAYVCVEQ